MTKWKTQAFLLFKVTTYLYKIQTGKLALAMVVFKTWTLLIHCPEI
jgi:hypothetical protein